MGGTSLGRRSPRPSVGIDFLRSAIIHSASDANFNMEGIGDAGIPDENNVAHMITMILSTGFGDGDLNQIIDFKECALVFNNFGMGGTGWEDRNYNLDAVTNFNDFVFLTNNFNMSFPAGGTDSTMPEPASGVTLVLVAIAGLACKTRGGTVSNI